MNKSHPVIPTRIVPSPEPAQLTPRAVRSEFDKLLDRGARLLPAGQAKKNPKRLLRDGYGPTAKLDLFDTTFYLSRALQNPDLRFFVAYVIPPAKSAAATRIYPRIFYKDVSLIWRAASHIVRTPDQLWIGKGDVRIEVRDGYEHLESAEDTTDLPTELQPAMEVLNRRNKRTPLNQKALDLVLRKAPPSRIQAYADFIEPMRRAESNPRNRINGGRHIARIKRKRDPSSLEFTPGFEPDFENGLLEKTYSTSSMYGGRLTRCRIVSTNGKVQYLFFAGDRHVWIIPAQALTTEITTFGVRSVTVHGDDDVFVPGYEYHFMDDSVSPPEMHTQIPKGFAGDPSKHDDSRADASSWIDCLPVVQEFRRKILRGRVKARFS